jgi:hypothetical protein
MKMSNSADSSVRVRIGPVRLGQDRLGKDRLGQVTLPRSGYVT